MCGRHNAPVRAGVSVASGRWAVYADAADMHPTIGIERNGLRLQSAERWQRQ